MDGPPEESESPEMSPRDTAKLMWIIGHVVQEGLNARAGAGRPSEKVMDKVRDLVAVLREES